MSLESRLLNLQSGVPPVSQNEDAFLQGLNHQEPANNNTVYKILTVVFVVLFLVGLLMLSTALVFLSNSVGISIHCIGIGLVCFSVVMCVLMYRRKFRILTAKANLCFLNRNKKNTGRFQKSNTVTRVPILNKTPLKGCVEQLNYIRDHIKVFLSPTSCNDPHIESITQKIVSNNMSYIQFSFVGDEKTTYKLNAYPSSQKPTQPSYIAKSYNFNDKARQAINDLNLTGLKVLDMTLNTINVGRLNYDFIKTSTLDGYVTLSEENSHLLSKSLIDQLVKFICMTGAVINWENILINPDDSDHIYLNDLDLLNDTNQAEAKPLDIETSIFGENTYDSSIGLINCLVSEEAINNLKKLSTSSNPEHEKVINNRLLALKKYQSLNDMIQESLKNDTALNKEFLVHDLKIEDILDINKDVILRFSFEEGAPSYILMSEVKKLLQKNQRLFLDYGIQVSLSKEIIDYLQGDLLNIINFTSNNDNVEYFDTSAYQNPDKTCVFILKKHPEFLFKVYKGVSRDKANKLALDSYNSSVIVREIIKSQNLNLLKQPRRALVNFCIDNEDYTLVVSEYYWRNWVCETNLESFYNNGGTSYNALKHLIKLLSIYGININSCNTIPSINKAAGYASNQLWLTDIESDDIANNFAGVGCNDYAAYGKGILELAASKEVIIDIILDSLKYGVFPRPFYREVSEILNFIRSCEKHANNLLLRYNRAKYFCYHQKRINPHVLPSLSIPISVLDGALDLNLICSGDNLPQVDKDIGVSQIDMSSAVSDMLSEIERILIDKQSQPTTIVNSLLKRTITSKDIKTSVILSHYSQVYSDGDSLENRFNWLDKVIHALIANGYACPAPKDGFCI